MFGDRRRILLAVHQTNLSSLDKGTTTTTTSPMAADHSGEQESAGYGDGYSAPPIAARADDISSSSDDDDAEGVALNNAPKKENLNASFQEAVASMTRAFVSFADGDSKVVPRFSSFGKPDPENLKSCEDVEKVVRDFYSKATLYGRVIISEMSWPDEEKTVKPVQMGGTLGGKKFLVGGILFKFGETSLFPQYADPWYIAQKIQGHEMKGLAAYFAHFFNNGRMGKVCFPMMAIIDYKV